MAGKTTAVANRVLNLLLKGTTFTPPSTYYLALFTAAPNEDGTGGTEVSATDYVRQPVVFSTAADGVSSNTAVIDFDTTASPWGIVTHFVLFDAVSGGEMWFFTSISPYTVPANGIVQVQIGDLRITEG